MFFFSEKLKETIKTSLFGQNGVDSWRNNICETSGLTQAYLYIFLWQQIILMTVHKMCQFLSIYMHSNTWEELFSVLGTTFLKGYFTQILTSFTHPQVVLNYMTFFLFWNKKSENVNIGHSDWSFTSLRKEEKAKYIIIYYKSGL